MFFNDYISLQGELRYFLIGLMKKLIDGAAFQVAYVMIRSLAPPIFCVVKLVGRFSLHYNLRQLK